MRILTVSDRVVPELNENFERARFGAVDMVLSCGDLPPEYLRLLAGRFGVPLYYVRGNHDIRYDDAGPTGCVNLDGRLVQEQGLTLLGLEGSRWYNGGPCQYTENQMRFKLLRLKLGIWRSGRLDIVIAHAPPRHVHDAEDLCHRGFRSYRRLIDRHAPRYFIHGHIHRDFDTPEARVTVVNRTHVVNTYGYHVVEIETH